jgi:hypothetical protein
MHGYGFCSLYPKPSTPGTPQKYRIGQKFEPKEITPCVTVMQDSS